MSEARVAGRFAHPMEQRQIQLETEGSPLPIHSLMRSILAALTAVSASHIHRLLFLAALLSTVLMMESQQFP
jgi:hypothetical protein